MYPYLGDFSTGATIFFPFATYDSNGASVTLTGLATTDIEVYKGASMTQRSSDAGFALVDTDGIDLDGVTGIHGFTIDTSDNTDSGFYAAGSDYTVVVSAVTVDSQTVNFIAGRFSIDNRSTAAIATNVSAILSDTGTDGVVLSSTTQASIADTLLNRDMSTGTDSGSPTVRTVRQALRFLRNKWSISGTTLTVTKEDDSTASWTGTLTTDAGAEPVTGNDPASA